jgi:hypothetical protein
MNLTPKKHLTIFFQKHKTLVIQISIFQDFVFAIMQNLAKKIVGSIAKK